MFAQSLLLLFLIWTTCHADSNVTLLRIYDFKTCKNEPSCYLVDEVPADRRTLRKRPCMCDADCVRFRDCCTDSKYYEELEQSRPPPFSCLLKAKVYVKTTCPETWTDVEIASKCGLSRVPLGSEDVALIVPVTNTVTNTTYGNKYCAVCHADNENLHPWNVSPSCGEPPPGFLSHLNYDAESASFIELRTPSSAAATTTTTTTAAAATTTTSTDTTTATAATSATTGDTAVANLFSCRSGGYVRRGKRDTKLVPVDYTKYARSVNKVWKSVQYDPRTGYFVTRYGDKDLICEVTSVSLPSALKSRVRACVPRLIDTCDPTVGRSVDVEQYCRNHTSVVFDRSTSYAYRNRYCAQCRGVELAMLTGCPIILRGDVSTSAVYVGK